MNTQYSTRKDRHKQAGYQAARVGTSFVAILHGTPVMSITGSKIIFNTGGWHTRATVKAINGALVDAGYGWRARLNKGTVQVSTDGGINWLDVNDELEISL